MSIQSPTSDAETREVAIDGHRVTLKHLGKILYPETGTTKAELLAYYARIADTMLPHLRERAVTLKRYPHGVEGESFFEKSCPSFRPKWMRTVPRFTESKGRDTEYCLVNDSAALIWLVNLGVLEFHVPLATRRAFERPRSMVFDLDPGPGATIIECCAVGLALRDRLADDGLEAFAKTSGSKGLQLYVPLNRPRVTFEQTKAYARQLAQELSAEHPDLIVSNMRKALRNEKVLIDWSQNDSNKTTVCAYSTRARSRPTVSAPVSWSEVKRAGSSGDPEKLVFTIDDVVARVTKDGDLFQPVLDLRQSLPRRRAA
jgi:bifunctional non-homologous end joining protein LigD